jgi:hypothetical protein
MIGGTTYYMLGWFSGTSDISGNDSVHISYDKSLEDFSKISIDGPVVDITIKSGPDYRLSFRGVSDLEPTDSVEQGVLTIKQPNRTSLGLNINNNCEMTLTVPTDSKLDFIDISSDV